MPSGQPKTAKTRRRMNPRACRPAVRSTPGHHERRRDAARTSSDVLGEQADVVDEVREQRRDDAPVAARGGGSADVGPGARRGTADLVPKRGTAPVAESRAGRSAGTAGRTAHEPVVQGQEIVRTGLGSAAAARTLIRAATIWAIALRAWAAGPGSRWATAGTPTSPPWRTVTSRAGSRRDTRGRAWRRTAHHRRDRRSRSARHSAGRQRRSCSPRVLRTGHSCAGTSRVPCRRPRARPPGALSRGPRR